MSQVVGYRTQPESFASRQAFRSDDDEVASMLGEEAIDLMSNVHRQRVLIVRYDPAIDRQCVGLHKCGSALDGRGRSPVSLVHTQQGDAGSPNPR